MRYSTVEVWDHHNQGIRLRLRAEAVYDFVTSLEDAARVYVNDVDVTGDPDAIIEAQSVAAEPGNGVVWHDNITRQDNRWYVSARSVIEHDPWETTPPMPGCVMVEVIYHAGNGSERYFTCIFEEG